MNETKIDIQLFIQIITSEDGIDEDFEDEIDGEIFKYYRNETNDKQIAISMKNEYITNRTAKALMRQLGIQDLIISLFPNDFQ